MMYIVEQHVDDEWLALGEYDSFEVALTAMRTLRPYNYADAVAYTARYLLAFIEGTLLFPVPPRVDEYRIRYVET